MIFIDSHCHIDGQAFDADRDETVERAKTAGVKAMLVVGTGDPHNGELAKAVETAEKYKNVFAKNYKNCNFCQKLQDFVIFCKKLRKFFAKNYNIL